MKKTWLALLLAVIMSLTAFGGALADEKPEKLVLITDTACVDLYNAAGDILYDEYGIELEIIAVAYDNMHDKITTSVLGGSQVDIVSVDSVWPSEFYHAGITQPITGCFTEEELSNFFEGFVNEFRVDGELVGIATMTNSKWLFYNKAYLEAAGYDHAPTTWAELSEMSQKMVDMGICKYGIAWSGLQAEGVVCEFSVLIDSFGGAWQDENGDWAFNSPEGLAALEYMVETTKNGVADPASSTYSDRVVLDPFMAGDTAFVLCWSYGYGFCNDPGNAKIAGNVDIALVPGVEGTVSGSTTGGGGLGISATTKYKEYAEAYLRIVCSDQIQRDSLTLYSNTPIARSVLAETAAEAHEFGVMLEEFEYATKRPTITAYSEWSAQIQAILNQAIAGTITPQEALDQMSAWSANY